MLLHALDCAAASRGLWLLPLAGVQLRQPQRCVPNKARSSNAGRRAHFGDHYASRQSQGSPFVAIAALILATAAL